MFACLAVTCHLPFWQKDRGLLRVTAVKRGSGDEWVGGGLGVGGGTDTEIRVSMES